MSDLKIACIHSGLRKGSRSEAIMNSVIRMLPEGSSESISVGAFPLYNEDLDGVNASAETRKAREVVENASMVIIVTSEYNHGLPGSLKNALDWLSRPVQAGCMKGKPVFFISQSNGALGGVRAQCQLRETLSSMLCEMLPLPEIAVTFAEEKIRNGFLTDDRTISFISTHLTTTLASQPGQSNPIRRD